jgi:hypothetical protein
MRELARSSPLDLRFGGPGEAVKFQSLKSGRRVGLLQAGHSALDLCRVYPQRGASIVLRTLLTLGWQQATCVLGGWADKEPDLLGLAADLKPVDLNKTYPIRSRFVAQQRNFDH